MPCNVYEGWSTICYCDGSCENKEYVRDALRRMEMRRQAKRGETKMNARGETKIDGLKALELLKKYAVCGYCGNQALGNGEGTLKLTEDYFVRTCKCGWKVEVRIGEAGE